VTQLAGAGVSWHSYQENLGSGICGISSSSDGLYAPKHDPMVFFADIVGAKPSDTSPGCTGHIFDYSHLASDLASGAVGQYNFITPNLCDDMHNSTGCSSSDSVANGDAWLSNEVPKILSSKAYKNGGALFITWDESETGSAPDVPIGMILLSPLAKGAGYVSHTKYYHSSFLRTVETIFGVPPLRDAANQADLSDLFKTFP
jgi:acid phosphatase